MTYNIAFEVTSTAAWLHYSDVIMSAMASQIISVSIVYNRLFRRESKKASQLRHWPVCVCGGGAHHLQTETHNAPDDFANMIQALVIVIVFNSNVLYEAHWILLLYSMNLS